MGLLDSLVSGGDRHSDYQDFANRYDQGHPAEGYTDEEAVNRHQEIAAEVPHEDYMKAAQESFERLSPDERLQFGRHLNEQMQQQQVATPNANAETTDDHLQDSGSLAQMVTQLQRQQPGMLGMVLGGPMMMGGGRVMVGGMGGGSMFGGGGGGGMFGGGGSGGAGSILSNPIAKAALGGIARFAFKRIASSF